MRLTRTIAAVIFVLSLTTASAGAGEIARVDAKASTVSFSLGATGHTVRGAFAVSSGELRLDLAGGKAAGTVVVDATSARTGNARRDATMHREVLESARYPQILFTASSIKGTLAASGISSGTVRGTMSIHGSDHPVSLPVTVRITGNRFTARSAFDVPYVAWGLKDPSVLLIRAAKKVRVEVVLEGTLSDD